MASIDSAQLFIESVTLLHTSVHFFHLNDLIANYYYFVKLLDIINIKTVIRNNEKITKSNPFYFICLHIH